MHYTSPHCILLHLQCTLCVEPVVVYYVYFPWVIHTLWCPTTRMHKLLQPVCELLRPFSPNYITPEQAPGHARSIVSQIPSSGVPADDTACLQLARLSPLSSAGTPCHLQARRYLVFGLIFYEHGPAHT